MTGTGKCRVVIDTNLWISFLIGKRLVELASILSSGRVILVMSTGLMNEILEVANRPKFSQYYAPNAVALLEKFLYRYSEFHELSTIPKRCRDPKDDFLLELSIVSQANYLISGDSDLTDIGIIGSAKIVTFNEFKRTMGV